MLCLVFKHSLSIFFICASIYTIPLLFENMTKKIQIDK